MIAAGQLQKGVCVIAFAKERNQNMLAVGT